ncbi:MAG: hypothetical protein D6803_02055 [Anaerolineae bacterium]|nr:MAG: hypothetical protein D6803_02055 [Anaerolineae bacterium]
MRVLFLFLDGVGLGPSDAESNPFARTALPNLERLLGGRRLTFEAAGVETAISCLLALDAGLGVDGLPQSATGQATLLTGKNIPRLVGEHFGPKPNARVRQALQAGNLFSWLRGRGRTAALLNAYPEAYFRHLNSGRRLPGAVAMAARLAGLELMTAEDLFAGRALSADFTGKGWRERLGYAQTPLFSFDQAGRQLAALAQRYDFSLFEFWISDVLGHRQDMDEAVAWLRRLDQVLGGLLAAWNVERDVILITSDHGNLEDLSSRRHTANPVPALIVGPPGARALAGQRLRSLQDVAPLILDWVENG